MLRRFNFEAEIYESLSCVPMAVRRKLDRAGIKIGLEQWQKLKRGERLAICHLPAQSAEELEVLRLFIGETVNSRSGSEPKSLPDSERAAAEPPTEPPAALVENAKALGVEIDRPAWARLGEDERYALIKLGAAPKLSHNLQAALNEFIVR
ncbi:MAG: nitrate reductase associated protein [Candidatus Binataceae bacterium]